VYEEWGRNVAGTESSLDKPSSVPAQARREALASALGLSAQDWAMAGLALPLAGLTHSEPTARELMQRARALAGVSAGVFEAAWGKCSISVSMRETEASPLPQ